MILLNGRVHCPPDHTLEKMTIDPWQQTSWDVNDMLLVTDPCADPDVSDLFSRLPETEYLPSWHGRRENGGRGPQEQAAASKSAIHADTPSVICRSLGRTFVTITHNRFKFSDTPDRTSLMKSFIAANQSGYRRQPAGSKRSQRSHGNEIRLRHARQ